MKGQNIQQTIDFCTQFMSSAEKFLVSQALETDWVTTLGPDQTAFENEFSSCIGTGGSGLATVSGTSALELAYRLLEIKKDDIVVCSTFTFIATIGPAIRMGAIPIFIDSEEDSWNMDPELLNDCLNDLKAAGKRAKAVTVAHIYGQSASISEIKRICDEHEVPLLEDAAEALGTYFENVHVGTFGLLSVFSFNGNKMITTGGGGFLCTTSESHLERARFLAFQAKTPGTWDYFHEEIGYNFKLSNVLAAIGRGQLMRLPEILEKKRQIHSRYQLWAGQRGDVSIMSAPKKFSNRPSHWINIISLDPLKCRLDREKLHLELKKNNIPSRPVWYPLHLQPVFNHSKAYSRGVAVNINLDSICLPSGLSLTEDKQEAIISALESALNLPIAGTRSPS